MGKNPTVVIVDDSAEVRALLRARLRMSGLLDVVGEAADGTEAIGLAYRHQPALLILDLSMPTMDGLDALSGVLAVSPETRVVVYTGFEEQGLAERAIELGATALIEKSVPIETLTRELVAALSSDPPATRAVGAVPDTPQPPDAMRQGGDEQSVLDEHLERFREVFEEAAIGMGTMTLTGSIVRANRALGALMLCKHEELVGLDYGTLTAGNADLLVSALADINERSVDLVNIEHDVTGSLGRRKVRATLAPVRDSGGRALYVFLQVQDVTAQRTAEDSLRQSEERFRLLVNAVEGYAIFMLSPEGIVTSWNAGAQKTKGYHADDIIGRHFRAFYPTEQQRDRHPERELELALRDGHYAEEGWRIRKDGSEFWANVLITPVFDSTGQHVGFAKVTRDVTADRLTDEALRQSEERFRLLVEAVGDYAIFMLDPDGRVVSWNTGAQRSMGYRAGEVIGQHFRIFYLPVQQAERHPENELEVALREGRYEEEGWRVRQDGTEFWATVVITAIFNEAGEHVGFAKITRDTTERRLAEKEVERVAVALKDANSSLETLNMQLRHAAADQSQFLAVTAHELRTPATVLRGSADTLTRHWVHLTDNERDGLLEGMTSSADRLQRLLSDLLMASRLDAAALQLDVAPASLNDLVEAAMATACLSRPDADISLAEGPQVRGLVDSGRLAQMLDNLIGNAFTHGAPPVRLQVVGGPQMAAIRISDSGPGVEPAARSRLFQRFATGDNVGGTGLGLFIVRELALAHGGDAIYEPGSDDHPSGSFVIFVPVA